MRTFKSMAWSLGIGTALAFLINTPKRHKMMRTTGRNFLSNSKKRSPKISDDEELMYYI